MEREQLELSQHDLEAIGFTGHYAPANPGHPVEDPARVWYSIPVINGEFIYNVDNQPYKWYLKTTIGDAANYNWLDIGKPAELYILLMCFKAKYNFIMDI